MHINTPKKMNTLRREIVEKNAKVMSNDSSYEPSSLWYSRHLPGGSSSIELSSLQYSQSTISDHNETKMQKITINSPKMLSRIISRRVSKPCLKRTILHPIGKEESMNEIYNCTEFLDTTTATDQPLNSTTVYNTTNLDRLNSRLNFSRISNITISEPVNDCVCPALKQTIPSNKTSAVFHRNIKCGDHMPNSNTQTINNEKLSKKKVNSFGNNSHSVLAQKYHRDSHHSKGHLKPIFELPSSVLDETENRDTADASLMGLCGSFYTLHKPYKYMTSIKDDIIAEGFSNDFTNTPKSKKYASANLGIRPPCIGQDHSTDENIENCGQTFHGQPEYSCDKTIQTKQCSYNLKNTSDRTFDSDCTTFMDNPMCGSGLVTKVSKNYKKTISHKLKKIAKCMKVRSENVNHLQTLAVL